MKKLLAAIILVFTLLSCLPLAVCAESDAETTAETVAELTTAEADEESVAETNDGPKTNFGFYPDSLKETLPVMGMGMLGIFVVIGTIVLVVLILRWMSGRLDRKED